MSQVSDAKWYVVHTYSGYENKVATDLEKIVESRKMQDLIMDIKIPTEKVTEVKEDKTREVERKIFPGYVMIKMIITDESWYVVRNTRGVTGFVGPASKPEPLSDAEVAAFGIDQRSVEVSYAEGDRVSVIAGPLKGMEGTVISIDVPANTVSVKVSMLGQEIPAEMELNQIAKIF